MDWNAAQWSETKRVSYACLTDVSYPLTARALYEALGEGLGTGAIPDNGEIVVNRRAHYSSRDDVPHENLVSRLEIVSERVDTMPSLMEVSS